MVFVRIDGNAPTVWCNPAKNDLVPRFKCANDATCGNGLYYCFYDPNDVKSCEACDKCYEVVQNLRLCFFRSLLSSGRLIRNLGKFAH